MISSTLASGFWWKSAVIRALRTALVIAIPYVPSSYVGAVPYITIVSAAALGFVLSILTSLAGIAETQDELVPWYYAILSRVVKTVAQALVAGIGTAILVTDVNWDNLVNVALTAGFGSLLLAFLSQLPEAEKPRAPATLSTVVINEAGNPVDASVPVVATASASTLNTPKENE